MIYEDTPNKISLYIQDKLKALAGIHNVKILLAIESGSRAWGFPSVDSDYDVRFIYSRSIDDYLSVETMRDVIETDNAQDGFLNAPLDLNGWDLRKTLQLALKSNAVVAEWLVSPIRYTIDDQATNELLSFVKAAVDLPAFIYHYDRLARHAWQDIKESGNFIKVKRYFYALRPALALSWLRRKNSIPPMNIQEMISELSLPLDFVAEVQSLIEVKMTITESAWMKPEPILDQFLEATLGDATPKPKNKPLNVSLKAEADRLFRSLI